MSRPSHCPLAARWRADAETLRRYGDERVAGVCDRLAKELEDWLRNADNELLTPVQAAADSDILYTSADHIADLLRTGKLRNHGRKHRPLVRRGDLPRSPSIALDPTGTDDASPSLQALARRAIGKPNRR